MKRDERWKLSSDPVESSDIQPQPCPACGAVLEAATGTGRPQPGTISMCYSCRVFLIFQADMTQRILSNREWDELPSGYRELLTRIRTDLPK